MKKDLNKNVKDYLYAPMLSISGQNTYQRKITDGLWTILGRARHIASQKKQELIQIGHDLTLPIDGHIKGNADISFVIYHVPFEKEKNTSIGSFDVPDIDHSRIKHLELVRWTIQAIHETVPSAEVIVCTDQQFGSQLSDLNPTILIPSVERHRPMYYRARTYNTIIQNKWCQGNTIFLDSDAIVLKDPSRLSEQLNFQVGLTARFAPNLMPINEGVIITKSRSPFCIDFFAHYMGTYEFIKNDNVIQSITKNDLMRWRGGQLSLNAICKGAKLIDARDSNHHLKVLPCSKYNYAVQTSNDVEKLRSEKKVYIAHIKGKSKLSLKNNNYKSHA